MAPQNIYTIPPPFNQPAPPPPSSDNWDPRHTMERQGAEPTTTIYSVITDSATTTVTPFADQAGAVTSSTYGSHHSSNAGNPFNGPDFEHVPPPHSLSSGVMAAAGVIATLVFIALLIGLCCFLCRRSRKSKLRAAHTEAGLVAGRQMTEAHESRGVDAQPYAKPKPKPTACSPPSSAINASSSSSSSSSSSVPLAQQSVPQLAPVILSTNMDHSYLTGIDTSDHISLADNHSTRSTDTDEPPPPYRPRSVPPISRESSVHIANGMLPNYRPGNRVSITEESIQNPFNDPDEALSELAEEDLRNDHFSVVSDLSYQYEPETTHTAL
jgi:hypothetical protein